MLSLRDTQDKGKGLYTDMSTYQTSVRISGYPSSGKYKIIFMKSLITNSIHVVLLVLTERADLLRLRE